MELAYQAHAAGNKLIFVGNGGSAAIASHMATDYSKNGNVRSLALNDGSMLTCLGNDLGYAQVFAKQIELHARAGDLVIAISSSGRSENILNAVKAARTAGCTVVTLSGFTPDNPLRGLGDVNFYLASDRYGFVEIGHLTICHAVLDFICGLRVPYRISSATAA
jgi:D-sedoheptulose 7-phosphate isomerase